MSVFPVNPSTYQLTSRSTYSPGLNPGAITQDTQPLVFVDAVPATANNLQTDIKMVQQDFAVPTAGTFQLTPMSSLNWTAFRMVQVVNRDNQTPVLLQLATCTINTTSTATVNSSQTLILSVNGNTVTVTFGSTLSTPATIVSALNASATFSPVATAWLVSGLYIALRPLAANGMLSVTGGTGAATLGFSTANNCGPVAQPVRLEANGGTFVTTLAVPVTVSGSPNPLWPGAFTIASCDYATGTPGAASYQSTAIISAAGYV